MGAGASGILIQFVPDPPVDGRRIIALVQSGNRYRLPGPDRVRIEVRIPLPVRLEPAYPHLGPTPSEETS